jgi:hypothetical protein
MLFQDRSSYPGQPQPDDGWQDYLVVVTMYAAPGIEPGGSGLKSQFNP